MACYYTGSAEGDADLARQENAKALTNVTQMLCGVMTDLEKRYRHRSRDNAYRNVLQAVPGLDEWWEEHKKIDTQRQEKAEANKVKALLRKQALSKLSQEEYQALLDK